MTLIQIAYTVSEDHITSGAGKWCITDAERDISASPGFRFVEWVDEDECIAHVNVTQGIWEVLEDRGCLEINTKHGHIAAEIP